MGPMSGIERRSSDLMNVLVLQAVTGAFAFAALTMCPRMIGDIECVLRPFHAINPHSWPMGEIAVHHAGPLLLLAVVVGHLLPISIFLLRRRAQLRVQLQASLLEAMLVAGLWLTVVSERTQVVH